MKHEGFSDVDTAQLFRLLGQIEANTKQNSEDVSRLLGAIAENSVMTGQIRTSLDTMKIGMDITDIIAKEARTKAQEAYSHADGAHGRLNKLVWMTLGGGGVAGFVFGLFSEPIVKALHAVIRVGP